MIRRGAAEVSALPSRIFLGGFSVASLGKRRSHKVFLRREHDNNDD